MRLFDAADRLYKVRGAAGLRPVMWDLHNVASELLSVHSDQISFSIHFYVSWKEDIHASILYTENHRSIIARPTVISR